jgi:carboxyl-terminal processing protease
MRTSAVVFVLSFAVLSGALLLSDGVPHTTLPRDRQYLLGQVMDRVERSYIDSTTPSELYSFAVAGLLRRVGDPHATYIPAPRLALLRERTSPAAVGPGVDIDERDGWIVVMAPRPGSPADRAGVRAGDRIIQVNGRATHGLSAEEVRLSIQGSAGSEVNLIVERPGESHPLTVALTREAGTAQLRAFMLASDVGYVKLNGFTRETGSGLSAAVDTLARNRMQTLIVDMRGNPEGAPEDGVGVADLFLPEGSTIASTKGRKAADEQRFVDHTAARWDSLELILLVDGGTANASEVAAGALQELDRALVIGRPTYGKASRQQLLPLSSGGAVMLTTSRWYTPLGRSIDPTVDLNISRSTARNDSVLRSLEFKTASGRVVIGGGGIKPDVLIKQSSARTASLGNNFYEEGNAREIVERDPSVRIAVTLARQAQGQMDLFSRAQAVDSSQDDEAGR